MVYDDFVELAAACASTPTVIEVQCDGSLQPPGTDLILPAGTFELNGAILTGPRNLVEGITPMPDSTPRRIVASNGTTLRGVGGSRDGAFIVNAQGVQPVIEIIDLGVWVQALSNLIGETGPVLRALGSMIAFLEAGCSWENEGFGVLELAGSGAVFQANVGPDSSIGDDVIIETDPTQQVRIGRSTITSRVGPQAGVTNLFIQTDGDLENLRFNGPFGAFEAPPGPANMQDAWNRLVSQAVVMLGRPISLDSPIIGEPLPILLSFPDDSGANISTQRAYFVDTSGGGGFLNLPLATDAQNAQGRIFIKNTGANTITINAQGGDTVDGLPTRLLSVQWESVILISNGSNAWGAF